MDGDLEGRVVWHILVVRILRCIAPGEENMAISKGKKKKQPLLLNTSILRNLAIIENKSTTLAHKNKSTNLYEKNTLSMTPYIYIALYSL